MSLERGDLNTIHYHIYPLSSCDIEELQYKCLNHVATDINTVWNAEGFTLHSNTTPTPHLSGRTWFDNAIDDEWYIVWILRKLSAMFDIAVKVWDDDGCFVLIEAAHVIPSWLTPDTSDNRVFLYRGRVVVIPQPGTPAEMAVYPQGRATLHGALACIHLVEPNASPSVAVNTVVDNVTAHYPERKIHKIRCFLPLNLIHALQSKPQLVSTIISMYLYSDSRERQLAIRNRRLRWEHVQETNVRLTRCQYAQLYSQRVLTSHHWRHDPVGHKDHNARQMGLKLTLGAEIVLSIAEGESMFDPNFTKYVKKLHSYGYFQGLLEESKAYKELLNKAEVFFQASQKQDTGSGWINNGRTLNRLVREEFDQEAYMTMEVQASDSDSWMDVIPDDVQRWFLQGRGMDNSEPHPQDDPVNTLDLPKSQVKTITTIKPQPKVNEKTGSTLANELNSKLQGFIETISSYEGAEMPGDPKVDPEAFMNCLKELKGQLDRNINYESESDDTSSLADTESLCTESEEEMNEYMDALEQQLQDANLNEGFEKDKDGDVDVDLNLVSNILNSFSADSGLNGPASSVLASLGIHLPRNDDGT